MELDLGVELIHLVMIKHKTKAQLMAYVFSMGRETFTLQRNKQNSSFWKTSISVDGEPKTVLKSTVEGGPYMLLIMLLTFFLY